MPLRWMMLAAFLVGSSLANAQRGSFEYFESLPKEYLGKRITVFIIKAKEPVGDGDFRIFKIYTSDAKGDHESYGWAKVPLKNAALFAKRHPLQTWPYRVKNASGVLRQVTEGDPVGKILNKGVFYLDTSLEN